MSKTIGIDARFYGPLGKGLGRYAKEVVDNVLKIDQENNYVIFLAPENFDEFTTTNPKARKVLVRYRWYSYAEQFFFPFIIWREKIDMMHFLHFNVPILCPTAYIVTIHDLILINHPTARATMLGPIHYWIKNKGYRLAIWLAINRAQKVIAVSEFTKQDIITHFKTKSEKIIVTYEGVTELTTSSSADSEAVLQKFKIKKPYLLYIGNAYPHKNLEGLLEVFAGVHKVKPELQLVLVGREDFFYRQIKNKARQLGLVVENDINYPVVFTDFVNDSEMSTIYQNGLLYIFASFYEGFGLPPLEAMANNLPVLSSNRASMPEVLGAAAAYFNPSNQEEFKAKILELADNANLRIELSALGAEQVKKYNWQTCAKQTHEVYLEVK